MTSCSVPYPSEMQWSEPLGWPFSVNTSPRLCMVHVARVSSNFSVFVANRPVCRSGTWCVVFLKHVTFVAFHFSDVTPEQSSRARRSGSFQCCVVYVFSVARGSRPLPAPPGHVSPAIVDVARMPATVPYYRIFRALLGTHLDDCVPQLL